MVRKNRYLRNNLGLTRRFYSAVPYIALGRGLCASAATADAAFNLAADKYFDRWASSRYIDVTGRHNFYSAQSFVAGEMMCDGEVYAAQIRARSGFCQLQFFRSHQVGDPFGMPVMPGAGEFRDGIRTDSLGKPVAYRVLQEPAAPQSDAPRYRDFRADEMLQVLDPERINQRRGLPWAYTGANSCIDILDLLALEKVAVKVHGYFAAAITRPDGPSRKGLGSTLPNSASAPAAESSRAYETLLGGGAIPVFKPGEELRFFTSNRPSTTFAGFIDFLVRDIAWGFGLSPEFVWNIAAMGGANTRFILEDAQRFVERVQGILIDRFCQPIYTWVTANAILAGDLPVPNDPDWWVCNWTGPAKMTVDRGRDGKLMIDLKDAGMLTLDEYWTSLGLDPRAMRRRRIDEIAEDMAYCTEKGVPYQLYSALKPGVQPVTAEEITSVVRQGD